MVGRWLGAERTRRWRRHAEILAAIVALFWGIVLADALLFQGWLHQWGIRPRTLRGLIGIPLAPLLHAGVAHVAANTLPFLVLGWLVMLDSLRQFAVVSAVVLLVSGLGVWLFSAADNVHLGASGLIFGYFGYLLVRAWFDRRPLTLLVAAVALLLYGGLFWGVLPTTSGVSWPGHLFGFLGGALAARLFHPRGSSSKSNHGPDRRLRFSRLLNRKRSPGPWS